MSIKTSVWTLSLSLVLAVAPFSLSAQNGTLTGTVTDRLSGVVVAGIDIQILGGGQTRTVTTDDQGRYSVTLPAGRYALVVSAFAAGFEPDRFNNVGVSAGGTATFDLTLTSRATLLTGFVVSGTPGPRGERLADAANSISVIRGDDISQVPNLADLFHAESNVSVATTGIQSAHPVVRGFNNIFSGSLHMLTDLRLAGVPSLRVNLMHFIPSNAEDLDHIEIVAGPSSALYGPNTANGIIHFLTTSPLDVQGTSVTLGGGERSLFQGSGRRSS